MPMKSILFLLVSFLPVTVIAAIDTNSLSDQVVLDNGIFYPKYNHTNSTPPQMGSWTNSDGDVFLNGVVVDGPDAFWLPQNAANSDIAALLGYSSLNDLAASQSFYGVDASNIGGLISGDGETLDQVANDYGYDSALDMVNAWGWQDSMGSFASLFGVAVTGDGSQFLASLGGQSLLDWATSNQLISYIPPVAPIMDPSEQASLVAATAQGLVSPSDMANLVQSGIIQSGDGTFVNNMVNSLLESGDDPDAQALYTAALRDQSALGSTLNNVDFTNYSGSGQNLSGLDLSGVPLTGSQLNGAYLSGDNLSGMNMTGFDSTGMDLTGDNFTGVTNFNASMLNGSTSIYGANLSGLDLTGFNPQNIYWQGANLSYSTGLSAATIAGSYAQISGLNLTGTGITYDDLYSALMSVYGDPSGFMWELPSVVF